MAAVVNAAGAESLPTLPALRSLAKLADVRPVVVIDNREQCPLVFSRLQSERGTLQTGDYSFRGGEELFAVERKSVADFVGCTVGENRERFFRELHRLRGYRFKRLLIVGTREEIEAGQFRSNVNPRSVLATLSVIEVRFDVPIVFKPTPEDAGRLIESWVYWFAREIVCAANALARGSVTARGLTSPAAGSNSHGGSDGRRRAGCSGASESARLV